MRNGKKEASWTWLRNPAPATSYRLLWTRRGASVFLTMLWQNLGLKKLKRSQWYCREFNSRVQKCWILNLFWRGHSIFWAKQTAKPFGKKLGQSTWLRLKRRMTLRIILTAFLQVIITETQFQESRCILPLKLLEQKPYKINSCLQRRVLKLNTNNTRAWGSQK